MRRLMFFMIGVAIGLISPLAIGYAFAQYDPYAPPRARSAPPQEKVQIYNQMDNSVLKPGRKCRLKIEGEDVFSDGLGICNISRGIGADRERTTIIDAGSRKLKIVRDQFDKTEGTVFGAGRPIQVFANSSCWRGAGFLFCAD